MKLRTTVLFLLFLLSSFVFGQNQKLEEEINSIIKDHNATIGVAVIYDGKDTLIINNNHQYPTMSTYKFHQALALLSYMDKYGISLDTEMFVNKADLDPDTYSPLRDTRPEGDFNISIRELIQYTVSQSDNNATDILFHYMLGTKSTDLYIRSLGLNDFSINATEFEMSLDLNNEYLNWTTPLDAVRLLDIFYKKELFSSDYKDFLIKTMIQTTTGPDKLKGLLPKDVIVAHKTGSSSRSKDGRKIADNDIGFVFLPNGKYYSIAVFVSNSKEDDKTNASIIAQISKAVYDYYKTK